MIWIFHMSKLRLAIRIYILKFETIMGYMIPRLPKKK